MDLALIRLMLVNPTLTVAEAVREVKVRNRADHTILRDSRTIPKQKPRPQQPVPR